MKISPATDRRRRGRPSGSNRTTQRSRLLSAAQALLSGQPSEELTLRRVAHQADVTPALAHYYFRSREGLLESLLADRVAPRIEDLVASARARAGQPQLAITFLMQRTCSLLAADPLLRRCIWLPQSAALELRNQLRACLRELLVRGQNMQTLRADLSPDYLTDSLLGLLMFPFLDETMEPDAGGERVAQLTLQHVALLRDGIVRTHKPRQESSA